MLFELSALALACFEFVQGQILVEDVSTLRPPRPNEEYFRTFKFSSTTRPTQPKADPDEFFFGFFPLWSAALACLTGSCLLISLIGMLCWWGGCTNPRNELIREAHKLKKQQLEQDLVLMEEQFYDDISDRMIAGPACDLTIDRVIDNNSILFSNSRLINSELDMETKYLSDAKKKIFMKDHL